VTRSMSRSLLLATLMMLAALTVAALAPANSSLLSASDADAAVVRSYADGPVMFLNKRETLYATAGTAGAAGGLIGFYLGGPAGVAAGGALAGIADQWAQQQVAAGNCIQVKMWYWNPWNTRPGWYRDWWPCY
jgi:hypothetical protein